MSMIITTLGHAAILDASANGLRLTISEFAVGQGTNLVPSGGTTSLEAEVFRAPITVVQSLTPDTMQFTCEVPASVPEVGLNWSLSEFGLYTDTGILFAVGLIEPYYPKQNGVLYRPVATLTLTNATDLLEININTHMSLPYVPVVEGLSSPVNTLENATLVGDGFPNSRGADPEYSSVLAVTTGGAAEITEWAFPGLTRIEHRIKPTVIDRSQTEVGFDFSIDSYSWFYPDEVVLVQVVIGAATGQLRKYRYSDSDDNFQLIGTDAFSNFIAADEINIWRSVGDVFPSATLVPDGRTLQLLDGRPVWGVPGGNLDLSFFPRIGKVVPFSFEGDGIIKSFELPEDACYSVASLAGSIQDQSAYAILDSNLVFAEAPCHGSHEIMLLVNDISTTDGVKANFHVGSYTVGAGSFNSDNTVLTLDPAGTWPESGDQLFVFHAHSYRDHTEWTYDPVAKTITWPASLVDGVTEVRWLELIPTVGSMVSLRKYGFIGDGVKNTITLPSETTVEQAWVFAQGGYYDQTIYNVDGKTITLASAPKKGKMVEVFVWENLVPELTTMVRRDDENVPALNSPLCPPKEGDFRTSAGFPQQFLKDRWVALRLDQTPHTTSHLGDGVKVTFDAGVTPRFKESCRLNVSGRILMMSEFSFNGSLITLSIEPKLEMNKEMEITVFDYWTI